MINLRDLDDQLSVILDRENEEKDKFAELFSKINGTRLMISWLKQLERYNKSETFPINVKHYCGRNMFLSPLKGLFFTLISCCYLNLIDNVSVIKTHSNTFLLAFPP